MTDNLSEDKIAEFKAAFELFDTDETGRITWIELGKVFKNFGQHLSREELEEMIKEVDIEGYGYIDFEGFLELVTKKVKDTETEEELFEAFKTFDKEGNGYFTVSELTAVLKSLGETLTQEELDQIFKDADVDNDGQINYDDFIKFMSK